MHPSEHTQAPDQTLLAPQPRRVARAEREQGQGHRALTLWFTGFSGAGKSTLAAELERLCHENGIRALVLDGDEMRARLCRGLGYHPGDRAENARRIAEAARLLNEAGVVAICALISPFASDRQAARAVIGDASFFEVFIDTPLELCMRRDPKGLYAAARRGEISSFTGVSQAYEPPTAPDLRLETATQTPAESAARLLAALKTRLDLTLASPA